MSAKGRPILFRGDMVRAILSGQKTQTRRPMTHEHIDAGWTFPLGVPGDRLWVRESWSCRPLGGDPDNPRYGASGSGVCVRYAADGEECNFDEPDWRDLPPSFRRGKGIPSIHMPRWASRINLVITAVRTERLNEISDADARSEGFAGRAEFLSAWRDIYGAGDKLADQWAWVITFEMESKS